MKGKYQSMSEFWLISAPGDKTNLQAWERMNTVTLKSNLSSNSKFHIPDLKVSGEAVWVWVMKQPQAGLETSVGFFIWDNVQRAEEDCDWGMSCVQSIKN